jgi:hypothetical protein
MPEPNRGGHGPGATEADEAAGQVLGGGGDDGNPSAQSLADKKLAGQDPYEAWHGRTPVVCYLKTFDCVANTKDLGQLCKLDDYSKAGVFIGYAEGAKVYRILDLVMQRRCLNRARTELGTICHSTSDPTELVNASTSISYCPHH